MKPRLCDPRRYCRYCGVVVVPGRRPFGQQPNTASVQHVLPKRRGGTNHRDNLRLCCVRCNWLLEAADDCPGALACAKAVAGPFADSVGIRNVTRGWPRVGHETLRLHRALDAAISARTRRKA